MVQRMQTFPKCLLLPIDGTDEALRPARFLGRLYPPREVRLILGYFSAPPPPAISGTAPLSNKLLAKKRQFFNELKRDERTVFDHALEALAKEGFSKEFIQEHVEPRGMSVAKQECLLGGYRKVDAIVVQKRVKTSLEDLLRADTSSALVQQCIECPVWLTDGQIDPRKAAIYIADEEASPRITDHAAYMLSDTPVDIALIRFAPKIPHPISCSPSEAARELAGHVHANELSSLLNASGILAGYGIAENRVRLTLIPKRGDTVAEILSWCASNGVGIVGLGRTRTEGIFSFLRTSLTEQVASELKNMAVWIA